MAAIPYAITDLIIQRLQAMLDSNSVTLSDVLILRADSLDRMPRNVPRAIIVIPNGIRPDEQRRYDAAITEETIVVVATRNASTQLTGEGSRNDAGPLLQLVVQSLLGWMPGEPYSYMTMAMSPSPDHESGYGYYPLAFETTYVLSGVPS